MGTYRTYFDKNNTIIKNSTINTGRNPVSELYFGDKISRFLFYCSFDEIKQKVTQKEIILNNNVKHYLKIKNTSNFDVSEVLSDNNNLLLGDKYRSSSFDLELRPFREFWDEGMGFDFDKSLTAKPYDRDYSSEPSNWLSGTYTNEFITSGGTLGNVINTQHFDQGNEDIKIDITDFVNGILVSGVTSGITVNGTKTGTTYNYQGFCLKYTDAIEALTPGKTFATGLFTRHTQSFFEPFIETYYDDHIKDDRVDFYLNKINRLYLYVNVDGLPTNLDQLPTCTIQNIVLPQNLVVTQQTKGVYYVEFFANSTLFDSYTEYRDIWSGITINGISRPSISLKFIPKEENDYYQIGAEVSEPVNYGISVSGIKQDEKIKQGEKRKVYVHLRKPYTVEQQDIVTNVFYRLYVKQGNNQIEILDWQNVNKTYNSNNFTIDTSWMVPQIYYIDLKVERNGEVNLYNEELKFIIVSKLNY
jgi:hypothetical protein